MNQLTEILLEIRSLRDALEAQGRELDVTKKELRALVGKVGVTDDDLIRLVSRKR